MAQGVPRGEEGGVSAAAPKLARVGEAPCRGRIASLEERLDRVEALVESAVRAVMALVAEREARK